MPKPSNRHEYFVELLRNGTLALRGGHLWRMKSTRPGWKPKRADTTHSDNYSTISHSVNGVVHAAMSHRVIWCYLYGSIPEGMEINHKNGDKRDNRPENLELVSHARNIQHAYSVLRKKMGCYRGPTDPEADAMMRAFSAKLERERC